VQEVSLQVHTPCARSTSAVLVGAQREKHSVKRSSKVVLNVPVMAQIQVAFPLCVSDLHRRQCCEHAHLTALTKLTGHEQ
jgi:hypothetical protein